MRKLLFLLFPVFASLAILNCSADDGMPCLNCDSGSCNASDYGTVQIGSQVWMAKNWGCYAHGSKCYNNDPANCATYGRLYDWETAMTACPSGWHLPSNAEWDVLMKCSDNGICLGAGKYLKAASGWNDGGNGTDAYGFSALPGGGGNSGGSFLNIGDYGFWWSASEDTSDVAYFRFMTYNYEHAFYNGIVKSNLFSVRCVKN